MSAHSNSPSVMGDWRYAQSEIVRILVDAGRAANIDTRTLRSLDGSGMLL